jgi:hypothetical protein
MSHSADEDELDKQEIFQDLLSGSRCVCLIAFRVCFAKRCRSGPLTPYLEKSRWICPSIHPFLDLIHIFYAGLPEEERESLDDADSNE